MRLYEIHELLLKELAGQYPDEEITNFHYILSEHILGLSRIETSLRRADKLNEDDLRAFMTSLKRLKHSEPIQHITGYTEFYGLTFRVSRHTLIPRPETEELVDWVIKDHPDSEENLNVIDIGTGSGCIAISLAVNRPGWKLSAADISPEALNIADINASRNNCRVSFKQLDIRTPFLSDQKFDIIVSNPPYVRESEKPELHANVKDFEPDTALFVPDEDPLMFYRAIALVAASNLNKGGTLYLEINEYLGKETVELLRNMGFNKIELRKDFRGKPRMIKCNFHD